MGWRGGGLASVKSSSSGLHSLAGVCANKERKGRRWKKKQKRRSFVVGAVVYDTKVLPAGKRLPLSA